MGKKSQQKRERSAATQFRAHLTSEYCADMVRRHPGVDFRALDSLVSKVIVIVDGDDLTPLLEPRGWVDDHMEFDRAVCETGLKTFFRRTVPSDYPRGPMLDAAVPDVDLGEFVRVVEVRPGSRMRRGERIKILVHPG